MSLTREQFARQHLKRMGNWNPTEESLTIIMELIDTDPWVEALYARANAMTKEVYMAIPTIEPGDTNE